MLPSATSSVQPASEAEYLTPRRIRHITGVQIRNLTPFPVRDSFTSALTQPVEQSYFHSSGFTDDLGVLLSKKRSRKISANSVATRRSLKWEDGVFENDSVSPVESRGNTASTSMSNLSTSPSNVPQTSSKANHSLRGYRPRTSSMTSLTSNHYLATPLPQGAASLALPTSSFLPDNSQAALQNIIGSRLVETFITVALPTCIHAESDTPSFSQLPHKPLRSAPIPKSSPSISRNRHLVSNPRHGTTGPLPSKALYTSQSSSPDSAPPSKTSFKISSKPETRSKPPQTPYQIGTLFSSHFPSQRAAQSPQQTQGAPGNQYDPIYFSPIHRPSTNPFFAIDARSGRDFPQWSETSGQKLRIEVWCRTSRDEDMGKSTKQLLTQQPLDSGSPEWKMLDEWDFNLNHLVPLPDNIEINSATLPSNTVVIILSPPGQVLYLPSPLTSISRSSTPSAGYTSDPESEIRKAKQLNERSKSGVVCGDVLPLSGRSRRKRLNSSAGSREATKTAGWQELFKLVTLQSLISDNETSLSEVVSKTDGLLARDESFLLKRQMSEREARIRELRHKHNVVLEQCAIRKDKLVDRCETLKQRAESLAAARNGLEVHPEIDENIEEERQQLSALHRSLDATRTSLLSTLSSIFPIELYSPPDLLFTILDVPLPIPLNSNDPAPPLTLAEHNDVTEEAVAAALGYVAQVLQVLAAYVGKKLLYPVTCVGSRSLIRDGISAMVGPRMFPLFSKGVDTYRFEYGVFLLNKDIEMLMSERDLRALDIRHTLPNLKNLILTLSHDIDPNFKPILRTHSPTSLISGVDSRSRDSSPITEEINTSKSSHTLDSKFNGGEAITPTASGATTPTAALIPEDSRKSKSFLGFVPFTDFLRARYPSNSQSSDKREVVEDLTENADFEDDRTTIHDVASDVREGFSDARSVGGGTSTGILQP